MSVHCSKGLTLLEVLVALAIISATFGILVLTQASNLQISAAARAETRATAEANAVLERVVLCIVRSEESFTNAASGEGCGETFANGFVGEVAYGLAGTAFEEAGIIRVTVTVTEPSRVVFSRAVSCIDVEPAPAIARPAPCPPASGGS